MNKIEDESLNVIMFPDFVKLDKEVKEMRSQLSELLLERDQLHLIVCPNIETEYLLLFGSLEYKAYETQCSALRLKRKAELIQAKLNRQEKVIVKTIEEILVKKANGETIDSWNGPENENSTLSEITGPLMMIEDMRKEYVRNANCNEYLGKEGGKKDQLSNVIIRVNGLEDNQKSEGFEPGE